VIPHTLPDRVHSVSAKPKQSTLYFKLEALYFNAEFTLPHFGYKKKISSCIFHAFYFIPFFFWHYTHTQNAKIKENIFTQNLYINLRSISIPNFTLNFSSVLSIKGSVNTDSVKFPHCYFTFYIKITLTYIFIKLKEFKGHILNDTCDAPTLEFCKPTMLVLLNAGN
jgi:hypothetical protein